MQVRYHEHRARAVGKGAQQRSGRRIERIDPAIPGVPDEQGPREGNRAVRWRANDRPGGIEYTFGLSANAVLQRRSAALLAAAVHGWDETQTPQRHFAVLEYQAGSWPVPRRVIVKAEANAQGTNRRFIVSNRPGASVCPVATYDDYALRGESENRNKELKCGLQIDRTSDHRFVANFFRLYLHCVAFNLMVRFRQAMALPPLPEPPCEVPPQAFHDTERRRHYQRRRQRDRLAEAQPCTWRSLLIKVAAEVIVSVRRIVIRLSAHWPNLKHFQRVCQRLACIISVPSPTTS